MQHTHSSDEQPVRSEPVAPVYAPRPDTGAVEIRYAAPVAASPTGYRSSATDPAPRLDRVVDRVLAIQRPVVLAHLRQIRSRHPHANPAHLTRVLESRYLAAVTAGGAAVGAAAAVPGVGTVAALALTSAETVGFMEATALYAQSLAELHGVSLTDPDRARALVLTLLLGDEGLTLLKQVSGQAVGGATRAAFWGELVSTTLPRQLIGPLVDQLKGVFLRRAAKAGTASVIGKAMPYGIGAVIGGTGNHLLARRVVARSRSAFGPAPHALPWELAAKTERAPRVKRKGLEAPERPENRVQRKSGKSDGLAKVPKNRKTPKRTRRLAE